MLDNLIKVLITDESEFRAFMLYMEQFRDTEDDYIRENVVNPEEKSEDYLCFYSNQTTLKEVING